MKRSSAPRELTRRRGIEQAPAVAARARYFDRLRSRSTALSGTLDTIKETVIQEIRNVLAQFG